MAKKKDKKEKKVTVVVIQRGLRYNKEDEKGNIIAFRPNPGDRITLPISNARIERKTGNVRYLFKEEKEALKRKKLKKKRARG